jgi:hypothetical protein
MGLIFRIKARIFYSHAERPQLMSDPNFDHSEGDWEEFSSEPYWSESQWRNYLNGSDKDTARFLSFYNSVKDKPNHLDEVASLMGWDSEDMSMTEDFSFMENTEGKEVDQSESNDANQPNELGDMNDGAPYTLHRHPVFVVTSLTLPLFTQELGALHAPQRVCNFAQAKLGLCEQPASC